MGLEFDNGSSLGADAVIFATGYEPPVSRVVVGLILVCLSYGDARESYRPIIGEHANQLKPLWGLDDEGEINSVYRDAGLPNFYCMMGASHFSC
jgi:hypothetical protein